jgi:uncharacterized membrane protein
MVLGIVFLAIAVTFGIVMLALFLSGTTGFILAFLGFLLAFLLLGIVYLYSTRRFLENYRDRHIKKKEKVSFVSYHTNKTTFSNGTMSRYKDIQSDKNNKSS